MITMLILCTGNSARSIMAEAIANRLGAGRVRAFSAGSFPREKPHPEALKLLIDKDYDVAGLRSKSWDEFTGEGAPAIDIVITVCNDAAGETCPIFPGKAMRAHWGIADPAAVEGEEQREAFRQAYDQLLMRFEALLGLDLGNISTKALRDSLDIIGRMTGSTNMSDSAKLSADA